jgi:uncharacterized protein (DUF1697 family)
MSSYVALLRAINLAGHNKIAMADLRTALTELGFTDVQTVLQSGNVAFRGPARATTRLEAQLEAETTTRFGLEVDFMVRTGDELAQVVADNPFAKEAKRDPAHLLVLFLKGAIDAARVKALQSAIVGREVVRGDGRHVYAVYPDGIGRSKLTTMMIEKKLGVRATGRNWNTVLKLKELACSPAAR